ncbi:tetra-peptide repeat homeobox protein 1-like [Zootermopsis nevadensis]|uniref:tetra-peptide repeat homeobox protein 1-like n=1 Tax=Zootermopsis nevadensis TaxID=136037 RepID=UPI000B8E6A37|nr:tetra-peptide repeat homeobox protein 1-like [Zootermopsis nevadensis]XP_021934712.1 tetra-peptide repeat homeobox protein 1-like [Zootermopsis nevadensis]
MRGLWKPGGERMFPINIGAEGIAGQSFWRPTKEMSTTARLVVFLLLSFVFLAKTESEQKNNKYKRTVVINADKGGRVDSRSISDNGGYRGTEDRAGYAGGSIADHLGQGFSTGNGQAGSGGHLFEAFRVARPISVPQSVPVALNRHVPVAVSQPYPVTVPKLYPVAVPHPVTIPVPRPYPVTVPRPVPVPVVVPHPIGVPVPKPYPVPFPHPVPFPSPFLVGGGVPFSGFGGEVLNFGHGTAGVLLGLPEGHGLTTGYGHGFQFPLSSPGFEPSNSGANSDGNTPEPGYSSEPAKVSDSGLASSFSYLEGGKGAPPPTQDAGPPPSAAVPAPSRDGYHHGPT